MCCLIQITIGLLVEDHSFSCQNQIKKQGKGGAIGNSLTEKLIMKIFDKKNFILLKKLKVDTEMSKRYVFTEGRT